MACVCPVCGSGKSQVRDTDSKSYDVSIKRIRQCCDCRRRFDTFESTDMRDIKVEIRQLCERLSQVYEDVAMAKSVVGCVRASFLDLVE